MTALVVTGFSGETPRLAPELLPNSGAQSAINCRLTSGDLQAWAAPRAIETLSKYAADDPIVAVHRLRDGSNSYWLHWLESEVPQNQVVKLFQSPVVEDIHERIYYNQKGTTDSNLFVSTRTLATQGVGTEYPLVAYLLGNEPTTTKPTVVPAAVVETTVDIAYVVTFINTFGEESAPSPASDLASGAPPGATAQWAITLPATPSNTGRAPYSRRYLYRTVTGADGSSTFQFVVDLPAATTTYNDLLTDEELGAVLLPEETWLPPPTEFQSFTYLGNGVFVILKGKNLYFSEPYYPHHWPSQYQRAIGTEGLALEAIGNSLIVLTSGDPIVLTGTDPAFMSDAKLDINQPCVAPRGVLNVGSAVNYLSPVGYVQAGLGGSQVMTRPLFSKTDWADIDPAASSIATRYDDGFMFVTPSHQYLVTPSESLSVLSALDLGNVSLLYADPESGDLYYALGAILYRWDNETTPLAFDWTSKIFGLPKPLNFGWGRVLCDAVGSGSLTLKLYALNPTTGAYDLKHTQTVTNSEPFRLPSGYLAEKVYFRLEGNVRVKAVHLAQSMPELKAIPA